MWEPTWESVRRHEPPEWYQDAKVGVFLHWGLYSVPGWAPQGPDFQELLRTGGPKRVLRENPYAEWYLNTMQIEGSPTERHHRDTYGPDRPYDSFVPVFDSLSETADLDGLASFCSAAGAGYVVLTTKHADGFALWPPAREHPVKGHYHARRDLVGGLTEAVRAKGMRMGLYYCGGYDWSYNGAIIASAADSVLAVPATAAYREYATAHVRELIDRYRPSVLWNDICWPSGGNLAELLAHYYDTVEEGVVNDRWMEPPIRRGRLAKAVVRGAGGLAEALWRFLPEASKTLSVPPGKHWDFRTFEYTRPGRATDTKWEMTRGVGHSFGANRNEPPGDIITATELVRSLCDIVSKNGNLLIGVGPMPDGRIPEHQQAPLLGLGEWMLVNKEAVVGTRPWVTAESVTSSGTPVRYTRRGEDLYAFLLEAPGERSLTLGGLDPSGVTEVRLLGMKETLAWQGHEGGLELRLPERLPVSAVHTLRIGAGARAQS